MTHRAFDFTIDGTTGWALGLAAGGIMLNLNPLQKVSAEAKLTPAEARAMAAALEAAATFAENTLPTGLGESEAA